MVRVSGAFRSAGVIAGLLLCLAGPVAAGDVFVVDAANGPGADFLEVSAALAVALDGDVVLVRDGVYQPFDVVGAGVSVVADTGARIRVNGRVGVTAVPADSAVTLQGLDLTGPNGLTFVDIHQTTGPVLLQDCVLQGPPPFFPPDQNALGVRDCGPVTVVDCVLTQLSGPIGNDGLPSLAVDGGAVFVYGSSLTGGGGADGVVGFNEGADGAPAVQVTSGLVLLERSTLKGGGGGMGSMPEVVIPCADGGDGGVALALLSNGAQVLLRESALTGGSAGGAWAPCDLGTSAGATLQLGGSLEVSAAVARSLEVTSPLREGQPSVVGVAGSPGDTLFFLVSVVQAPQFVPGSQLVIFPGAPASLVPIGPLPVGGQVPIVAPTLPVGLEGLAVQVQAVYLDAAGLVFTSGGAAIAVVDATL